MEHHILVRNHSWRNRIINGRPFGVGCHRCARPPTKGAPSMIGEKYIGLDVHQATISVAVMDSKGKGVIESILETQAATILAVFPGLRRTLSGSFVQGTWGASLYPLLMHHV